MNCGLLKVQVGPPPLKLAVMSPLPVGDGPVTLVRTTVVSSLTLSLPALGSVASEVTVAVLVMVPEEAGSTATVTVYAAIAPAAIFPRLQVGTPFGSSAQPLLETNVTPAGRVSVTTTFCASEGPLLVMSMV